jgi:pyridoxamine 5'-phosphate oxidase family protein
MAFTESELSYLSDQALGRLATADTKGGLQNNPVSFRYNADNGTIDIGGHSMGTTRKFRNVQATGQAALVVDDIVSFQPWQVRGVEIRGRAEALTNEQPPMAGFSAEIIRIHPEKIISWGVDPEVSGMVSRKV